MDHYVDIKVRPDPEFGEPMLMNAVYSKLHRVLVEQSDGGIGVSFPNAKKTPGDVLRLHSERSILERLMAQPWLKGLRDYTTVTPVERVPSETRYIQVKRVQSKSTAARLRRAVKRSSMGAEEAEKALDSRRPIKQPFFRLTSSSTNQSFPLFIEQATSPEGEVRGKFNAYGLSQGATVPWF